VRKLILTGDDFGLSTAVNEAIEEAHRRGTLSAASLMVGAAAAEDAVDRARRLRSLCVGLHLVLVDGTPLSPLHTVPDLVNLKGEFSSHLVRAGFAFFLRAGVGQQIEKEIRAQFQAFRNTGLTLDHVNCHHHLELHPTIGRLMLKVGREYGLRAVRYPYEPVLPSWRASRQAFGSKLLSHLLLLPWLALLKRRLRRAQVRSNHFVFGINDTGNMKIELVLHFLKHLPPGATEVYFHPASCRGPEFDRVMRSNQEEFETLMSPALLEALLTSEIQRIGFSGL
jgi:hopanoid biosynthesis associated protein HpnK